MASATPANPLNTSALIRFGREHFRAHIVERRRPFDRLVRRQIANDLRDRRHERIRIDLRVDEQAAAADLLIHRVKHRHRRRRHEVLVVHVGDDADDASRLGAHADELRDWIGPHQAAIDRVHVGEHPLREALADDHDAFAVAAIAFVEVAAGDDAEPERGKEPRRDGAELRARIVLAVGLPIALGRELRGEESLIAPRHDRPERHLFHAGQLGDAADGFSVEAGDLLGLPRVRHDRDVHRQDVAPESGLLPLKREERRDQHAGAREQDERRRDLRDGEHPEPAIGARS